MNLPSNLSFLISSSSLGIKKRRWYLNVFCVWENTRILTYFIIFVRNYCNFKEPRINRKKQTEWKVPEIRIRQYRVGLYKGETIKRANRAALKLSGDRRARTVCIDRAFSWSACGVFTAFPGEPAWSAPGGDGSVAPHWLSCCAPGQQGGAHWMLTWRAFTLVAKHAAAAAAAAPSYLVLVCFAKTSSSVVNRCRHYRSESALFTKLFGSKQETK